MRQWRHAQRPDKTESMCIRISYFLYTFIPLRGRILSRRNSIPSFLPSTSPASSDFCCTLVPPSSHFILLRCAGQKRKSFIVWNLDTAEGRLCVAILHSASNQRSADVKNYYLWIKQVGRVAPRRNERKRNENVWECEWVALGILEGMNWGEWLVSRVMDALRQTNRFPIPIWLKAGWAPEKV